MLLTVKSLGFAPSLLASAALFVSFNTFDKLAEVRLLHWKTGHLGGQANEVQGAFRLAHRGRVRQVLEPC